MQKVILLFVLFTILTLLFGCTTSENQNIETQDISLIENTNPLEGTCPSGKTEPCTGECGNFIDNDNDGFCDRSG